MLLSEAEQIHKNFNEEILAKIKRDMENVKVIKKELVKDSLEKYCYYTLSSLTEHYNSPDPEVYEWIAEKIDEITSDNIDKIVALEYFGIPIAQLLASRKGKPLAIIRKRPLAPEDKGVACSSSCEKGYYYIYGIKEGDSVILIDSAISTEETLIPIIRELELMNVNISDIVCIAEESYEDFKPIFRGSKLRVKSIIKAYLDGEKPRVEVSYDRGVSFLPIL
ncbi:MAG: phosphoribosyltransferase family protein [Thermoproteota archaeon]